MFNFELVNPKSLDTVPALLSRSWGETMLLAGGTDLLDMLKERLVRPQRLINLKSIPGLSYIKAGAGLEIGALTTIAEIAENDAVRRHFTVLAEAAESIATPQLRNMGTIGGNLCQRPRCWYFREKDLVCLKKGGEQCFAVEGLNKYHCIFGGGPSFIVHPSDAAPALVALQAQLELLHAAGRRTVAVGEFYQLPQDNLMRETVLGPNELITAIKIPAPAPGTRGTYLKFREKQSHDFALVSVAAVLQMQGRVCQQARLVLGGVAPIPWRVPAAEAELQGKLLTTGVIAKAAEAAIAGALPLRQNGYKIQLTKVMVRRALEKLMKS
ncbi:MAG: xanthine dehydrogenase family protein subunit M [candidate division KSB1 bacterium]|nr:xanthine dehydrogenase family protein subunit M [candidate division KSB1 bacterium]MDZ7273844.1 xanthine dehydrogenase family protein subunit M [candidate division KSB1 bacterium]MDZ7286000.1 xanthine dehydrogenase family protein subunit M [candidate division KSB1 bacterium]MDZ7299032.1 xanthine dehydrogenase family protein subunit M [candidate division KSB1 bacterium]MDZ7307997.1 xanthine dehydrogenase family protein subunit M [candidate division KSB1 bacterium]